MNDREYRLRQRIDELTDQRDQARAQLVEWRRRGERLRSRIRVLQRSLDVWRLRARRWRPKR